MRIEPGYRDGESVLHLTKTLLGTRAFCGAYCDMIGAPSGDAVACEDCNQAAREMGYGVEDLADSIWLRAGTAPAQSG